MVCPNCKSDDIVLIQNQHYCINCGQLVPASAVAAQSKPVAPKPAAKPEVVVAKTAPTVIQPTKAVVAVLEKPKPPAAPTRVKVMSDIKPSPAAKAVEPTPKPTATMAAVVAAKPSPVKVRPVVAANARVISRMVDSKPRPFEAKPQAGQTKISQAREPVLVPAALEASNAAWDAKFLPAGAMIAVVRLSPAWLLALFITIGGRDFTLREGTSLTSLGIFIIAGLSLHRLLSYLVSAVVTNAIAFGQAKAGDNRPVKSSTWWSAGYNSLPSSLGIDLICLIMSVAIAILALAGLNYLDPQWAQYVVLAIAGLFIVLVWLVRMIARQAIVLADLKPFAALRLGRQLLGKHLLAFVSAGILGLLANLLVIPAYFGAAYGVRLVAAALGLSNRWLEPATSIVVSGLYLASATLFVIVLWVEVYRHSVHQLPQGQAATLMTGRSVAPVRRSAVVLFGGLTGLLLAAYAYLSLRPEIVVEWIKRFV